MVIDSIDNRIPVKLSKILEKYFDYFSNIHCTEEIRAIKAKNNHDFTNLSKTLNIFDRNINWYRSNEGYIYYYVLNLRWAIGVCYLCHEYFPKADKICIERISNFLEFHYDYVDDREYFRKHAIYRNKIEKIKEIFGFYK